LTSIDTAGGFSETCVTLNKLAAEGYQIEGVASGTNGHYYAILRTNEPVQKTQAAMILIYLITFRTKIFSTM
jgi:hypothetical protein